MLFVVHVLLGPFLDKVILGLELDPQEVRWIAEKEEIEDRISFEAWLDESQKPYLMSSGVPAVYFRTELPEDCKTLLDAFLFAKQRRGKSPLRVYLVWSRRLSILLDKDGVIHFLHNLQDVHRTVFDGFKKESHYF